VARATNRFRKESSSSDGIIRKMTCVVAQLATGTAIAFGLLVRELVWLVQDL
jgi:hypothetical protein